MGGTDFTAVNVGDRVRLTGNDEVHEFVVCNTVGSAVYDQTDNAYYANHLWTVEILERAQPEMPSEPGIYQTSNDSVRVLIAINNDNGDLEWFNGVGGFIDSRMVHQYMPLTRLVPENASND